MNRKIQILLTIAILLASIAPTGLRAEICSDLFQGAIHPGIPENVYIGFLTDNRSGRKVLAKGYPIERGTIMENGVEVVYFILNIGSSSSIRYDSRMLFTAIPTRRVRARVVDVDDFERKEQERIVTLIASRQAPRLGRFPDSPARFLPDVASAEMETQRKAIPPEYVAMLANGKMVQVKEVLEEMP